MSEQNPRFKPICEECIVSANLSADEPEVFEMEIESGRIPRTLTMAFGVSLALHVVLLLSLTLIKFADRIQALTTITSQLDNDDDPLRYKFDATMTDQMGNDSNIDTFASSQEAAMLWAAWLIAWREEPHRRLTVQAPASMGRPAMSDAMRPTL